MIELTDGLPDAVIGLEAVGEVSSDDYETVASPAVEEALGRHDKLRLLHVLDDRFTGYVGGAVWSDTLLVITHPRSWERIAVVSDIQWVRRVVKTTGWSFPGQTRLFSNAERAEAEVWISEGLESEYDESPTLDPPGESPG